jgi:hypothetical protein
VSFYFGYHGGSRLDDAEGQTGRNDSPDNGIVTDEKPADDKQSGKYCEQAL